MLIAALVLILTPALVAMLVGSLARMSWSQQVNLVMTSRVPGLMGGAWDLSVGPDFEKVVVDAVETRAGALRVIVRTHGTSVRWMLAGDLPDQPTLDTLLDARKTEQPMLLLRHTEVSVWLYGAHRAFLDLDLVDGPHTAPKARGGVVELPPATWLGGGHQQPSEPLRSHVGRSGDTMRSVRARPPRVPQIINETHNGYPAARNDQRGVKDRPPRGKTP
jgi:hypothetical protein